MSRPFFFNSVGHNVAYLKISPYYKQFLITRYGNLTPNQDEPCIDFPVSSAYADLISRSLVNNWSYKILSNNSFSDNMFHNRVPELLCEVNKSLPSSIEKLDFFAVVIPDKVLRMSRLTETSPNWQLSAHGVVEFNKMVKREFWGAMLEFIDDCFYAARAQGKGMTRENAVSDFMTSHHIPMCWYESMLRYERRFRKDLLAEIKQKRERMQECSGQPLICTRDLFLSTDKANKR